MQGDIVFLMDASNSIGSSDFNVLLEFVADFVRDDIAVLTLAGDVEHNGCAYPVCLPHARNDSECEVIFERCVIAGWTMERDNIFIPQTSLREIAARCISPTMCSLLYRYTRSISIPNRTLCLELGNQTSSLCIGGEGGMLVCKMNGRWILQSLVNVPNFNNYYPSLGVDLRHPNILSFIADY
ncbi:mast cell tryptase-like [Haliotis cracherodii]|uniref:mast cell tryptase-like n=1 Tax=Haliotis cracherodii TaxID=6455 RepID=UPI0039EA3393